MNKTLIFLIFGLILISGCFEEQGDYSKYVDHSIDSDRINYWKEGESATWKEDIKAIDCANKTEVLDKLYSEFLYCSDVICPQVSTEYEDRLKCGEICINPFKTELNNVLFHNVEYNECKIKIEKEKLDRYFNKSKEKGLY